MRKPPGNMWDRLGQESSVFDRWGWAGVVVALILAILLLGGYVFEWKWIGFVKDTDFSKRTLWDWLKLLIVPAVLALGGLLFSRQQQQRERQLANERAQDEALQAYLGGMTELLLNHHLRSPAPSENVEDVRAVARARTVTVLARLDGNRKRSVLQFLQESGLINKKKPLISLSGADLTGVNLSAANLSSADLSGANLRWANLSKANLSEANLSGVELGSANLSMANLSEANLTGALIEDMEWQIVVVERGLSQTLTSYGQTVGSSNLVGPDLSGANLTNLSEGWRNVPNKDLERIASSLKGATMPNGQKYEE